ncbi:uncharacterized protein (TIGR02246 family) [Glaciihabitans tibetensis]|uniref:Uncharacterized protein (TIGR02246 family) n=1 Tax=Glaciihabitans tibetensis TaxID=1266600 RepID=A0A2T0VEJ0_9MICO|nr:nuclear transport factor 2 family protein [Glaciihabitans tibetensis]PRY68601.1 uncharacterized protein (TIGR02246 family) [Glaciihabitans tibetensis]
MGRNTSIEDDLLAVARNWAGAIVANDAARMAEYVTDDWVIVSASGVSPGQHLLELVASGALTHDSMDVAGPTRVRVLGSTAILTARIITVAHYRGERSDADEWTTDVFVRRAGRWLCELTHYTVADTGGS